MLCNNCNARQMLDGFEKKIDAKSVRGVITPALDSSLLRNFLEETAFVVLLYTDIAAEIFVGVLFNLHCFFFLGEMCSAESFGLHVEGEVILWLSSLQQAFEALFLAYYIFGIQYPQEALSLLQFFQM